MIKINKDISFLAQKAMPASKDDIEIARKLKTALEENRERCVAMAANMIGYNKAIIVFEDEDKIQIMLNPKIISSSKEYYKAKEGCLSLEGQRETKRYKKIKIEYDDLDFNKRIKNYTDFTAQIIQHEIDHLNGIII